MSVFRFVNCDVVAPYLVDSQESSQQLGTGQTRTGQQPGTKQPHAGHSRQKESKKEKKE